MGLEIAPLGWFWQTEGGGGGRPERLWDLGCALTHLAHHLRVSCQNGELSALNPLPRERWWFACSCSLSWCLEMFSPWVFSHPSQFLIIYLSRILFCVCLCEKDLSMLQEVTVECVSCVSNHKHGSEEALLWLEVSQHGGMFICPLHTGFWQTGLCSRGLTAVKFSSSLFILSQLTASITCLVPPTLCWASFLIKQAHKATFLEFFMYKLLSVFSHAWMVCTEKCRTPH